MTLPSDDSAFRIGPYRVLRHVAQGGAGAIYEVEDPTNGSVQAMKLAAIQPADSDRFSKIHRLLSRLEHPGVIRSRKHGTTADGRAYMLLDLVDGEPAQVFAKSMGEPGSQDRITAVITVAIHLAEALKYLHEHEVIHRDIKSANVLVRKDRSACIIDFGSAIMPGLPATAGHFVGTYTYASPEQIRDQPVDHRTDIYSMGVLLYRMLTGRRPLEAKNTQDLIEMHLHERPVAASHWVPGLPTSIIFLLDAMLEKKAEHRPQTAQDVAYILRNS
ncbi:MAG: serine/threonine protein kinase [Myxococcota bacterium]